MEHWMNIWWYNSLRKVIALYKAHSLGLFKTKTYIVRCTIVFVVCCVSPCMAAQERSSKGLPVNIRFTSTCISQVRDSGIDYIKGKVSFNLQTKNNYIKRPILRVVMLTDENGTRAIRDVIMREPSLKVTSDSDGGSIYNMTTTIPSRRTNDAGKNIPDCNVRTIECISKIESEVSKEAYTSANYEGVLLGRIYKKKHGYMPIFGFCKFNDGEKAKLLGYRLEVWVDGQCITSWESFSAITRKKYDLPDDWHITTVLDDKPLKTNESIEQKEVKAVRMVYTSATRVSRYVFKYASKFQYRSPWAIKGVNTRGN